MKNFSSYNSFLYQSRKGFFSFNKINRNLLVKSQKKFFGAHHHHEITGEVDLEKVYVKNSKEVKVLN